MTKPLTFQNLDIAGKALVIQMNVILFVLFIPKNIHVIGKHQKSIHVYISCIDKN